MEVSVKSLKESVVEKLKVQLASVISESGMTQQQIAGALGTSRPYVSEASSGNRVTLDSFERIARVLGYKPVFQIILVKEANGQSRSVQNARHLPAPPACNSRDGRRRKWDAAPRDARRYA